MIKYFFSLILVGVLLILLTIIGNKCSFANGLLENEAKIKENNTKIQQCEEIKRQLHLTAEVIRKQEFYDKDFVQSLSDKWHSQNNLQEVLLNENKALQLKVEALKKEIESRKYIGNFTITHYCVENYRHICNNGNALTTATGTVPTPGRTIAVDPRKIPYGTRVVVDGHTYIAEDTGGAIKGNKLDICVATHSEALQKGVRRNVPVYIIKE